jgi:hypothetical protein
VAEKLKVILFGIKYEAKVGGSGSGRRRRRSGVPGYDIVFPA